MNSGLIQIKSVLAQWIDLIKLQLNSWLIEPEIGMELTASKQTNPQIID